MVMGNKRTYLADSVLYFYSIGSTCKSHLSKISEISKYVAITR